MAEKEIGKADDSLPSREELYINLGLYSQVNLSGLPDEEYQAYIFALVDYQAPLEAFCTFCRRERAFNLSGYSLPSNAAQDLSRKFQPYKVLLAEVTNLEETHGHRGNKQLAEKRQQLQRLERELSQASKTIDAFGTLFSCPFDKEHTLRFFFIVTERQLIKIGQYPSYADMSKPQIHKYRKVLSKQKHGELAKAIGLNAHDVGIGSFVYLRRIFEYLIRNAEVEAIANEGSFSAKTFDGVRVNERIKLLKDYLPPFVVRNSVVYSILSKGVHDLSDEECKLYFPVLHTSIEIILDQELKRKEEQGKIKEVEDLLTALGTEIS